MPTNVSKKNAMMGRLALILTTLIWGTSFVVMKDTLDIMPTQYLLAFRFLVGSMFLFLFSFKSLKELNKQYLIHGAVLGVLISGAYFFQTFGLSLTTPGKNAFLTTTYCILTPFIFWITDKKKPDMFNIVAAVVCIVGVGFVSLQKDLSINLGDLLTICCGLFYGIHIVYVSRYVVGKRVFLLMGVQFAVAGLICLVVALFTAEIPSSIPSGIIFNLLYLSVMCTAICYALQTYGQKYTHPSSVAVIMTLESVFGAMVSLLFGYETLTLTIAIGFVLIFVAVLISETKLSFFKKNK